MVRIALALVGAALAGALSSPGAPALAAATALPPPSLPGKGTPCAAVSLPGVTLPGTAGCEVLDAAVSGDLAVAVWHAPDGFGVVASDRAAARDTSVALPLTSCAYVWHVGDVTGDGAPDAVIREGERWPCDKFLAMRGTGAGGVGAYHVLGRRGDGRFVNLGKINGKEMRWDAGGGKLSGIPYRPRDVRVEWAFDGRRFARTTAEPFVEVKGLTATATKPVKGHGAERAVDGDPTTAARLAEGELFTVKLPREIVLGRLTFSTGCDLLGDEAKDFEKELAGAGDLYPLFSTSGAPLVILYAKDHGLVRPMKSFGERWIDYVPSEAHPVDRIDLRLSGSTSGTFRKEQCVVEVRVWERGK